MTLKQRTTTRVLFQFHDNTYCIGKPFEKLADCVVRDPCLIPLYSDSTLICSDEESNHHLQTFNVNKVLITGETLKRNNNDVTGWVFRWSEMYLYPLSGCQAINHELEVFGWRQIDSLISS